MISSKDKGGAEYICLDKPKYGAVSKIKENNLSKAKQVFLYEAGAHFQYGYLCKELEMLKKKIEAKGVREISFIDLNLSVSSSETKRIVNSFANSLNSVVFTSASVGVAVCIILYFSKGLEGYVCVSNPFFISRVSLYMLSMTIDSSLFSFVCKA